MNYFRPRFVLLCIFCLLIPGCSPKTATPNLKKLYNRSAQAHPIDRNPVILIPGIKGSRLVSHDGELVWGAFGGGMMDPNTSEGARMFALPMQPDVALNDLTKLLKPAGVLDQVKIRLFGLSFQLKAYFNIIQVLGAGDYLDRQIGDNMGIDWGEDHYTCFQFAYDWRLSIDENARLLAKFIDETRVYVQQQIELIHGIRKYDVKFDLIAHSMGGLLSRYYLRYGGQPVERIKLNRPVPWSGAQHVEKLIMVGTPNAGSVEAVDNFFNGMAIGPLLPSFDTTVVGTIPAVYQLLPRNRHRHVVAIDDPDSMAIDIYDVNVWKKYGWGLAARDNDPILQRILPDIQSAEQRYSIALDHLKKSLDKAHRIAQALDRPATPPQHVSLHLFAGDAIDTPSRVGIHPDGSHEYIAAEPGDGIVIRSSALLDERVGQTWTPNLQSPIQWDDINFIFQDHLGLTNDVGFADNLLFLLLER